MSTRLIEMVHHGGTALGKTTDTHPVAKARYDEETGEWRVMDNDPRSPDQGRQIGLVYWTGRGWYARDYSTEFPELNRLVIPAGVDIMTCQPEACTFSGFMKAMAALLGRPPGMWQYYRETPSMSRSAYLAEAFQNARRVAARRHGIWDHPATPRVIIGLLLAALLGSAFLVYRYENGGPSRGQVVDTWHESAHWTWITICYPKSGCRIVPVFHEETWRLRLRDDDGHKVREGWHRVSQGAYVRCVFGVPGRDRYPDCAQLPDPVSY